MDENKPVIDFDDAAILEKFRSLLSKYQSQGKITPAISNVTLTASAQHADKTGSSMDASAIPLLSDVVVLHPSVIQPQPARLTPIQLILDAALRDANIEMDTLNKKALANALEVRLTNQIK
ncbi:hypothetical protein [Nitrosomonas ureae]|uniref:Uncharacterized protein n=1 Tax=Nitrosomonas ureae TaxID=44577 RepID=A0A1H9CVP5_9PROT|nr:hypothetical protein [Nitrosomonas ureae]SEQ05244.1 hypothetical protein SAMN05421510_101721 [Nitrosomonas ureae]